METKHRPSTDDDGVKHCFALPKITSQRVPEGIYEESIGMSGWNLIFNLLIGTINCLRQYFSQLKTVGRAETFVSWSSEKVNSKRNTKRKHALGWHCRDCRRGIWRGLPLATWKLCGYKSQYIDMYRYVLLYAIGNARRHDTSGGKG